VSASHPDLQEEIAGTLPRRGAALPGEPDPRPALDPGGNLDDQDTPAERRGDLRGAEREYLEELKQHPESYKAAFNLSRLYEQVGDREGQVAALKQSIESNPRFAEGHFYLAKAYLDSGAKFEEAVALARKGPELAPKSEYAPLGHYVLADLLNRLGRRQEAAQEVAKGRALEVR